MRQTKQNKKFTFEEKSEKNVVRHSIFGYNKMFEFFTLTALEFDVRKSEARRKIKLPIAF